MRSMSFDYRMIGRQMQCTAQAGTADIQMVRAVSSIKQSFFEKICNCQQRNVQCPLLLFSGVHHSFILLIIK